MIEEILSVIDSEWSNTGKKVNSKNEKIISDDDIFYPLEFFDHIESIKLSQLLHIQMILRNKNYELNQFGFNVVI